MKIALSAESTLDLQENLLKEFDIHTIPFSISVGEEEWFDGEKTTEEMFKVIKEKDLLPKTQAINEERYKEYFAKLLEEYDSVIHITLSSGISSANQNCVVASKNFDGKVFVIDSLSLSTGIALLCIYARKLIDMGLEPSKIKDLVESRRKDNQTSFVVYTLEYLYKGGRCSMLKFLMANTLKIRPQIVVGKDGKMSPNKKFLGINYHKAVRQYVEATLKDNNTPDKSIAFVTYSTADDEMINICKNELLKQGFERVEVTYAGSTITSHCGENTIGILYINGPEPEIN